MSFPKRLAADPEVATVTEELLCTPEAGVQATRQAYRVDLNIAEYENESTILNSYGLHIRKQNEKCNKGNKKELDTPGNKSKTQRKERFCS